MAEGIGHGRDGIARRVLSVEEGHQVELPMPAAVIFVELAVDPIGLKVPSDTALSVRHNPR